MDSHREELLERVKKDVRSVLITESGGMLLEYFMKIFRQLTNSTIPHRRLGYQTVEEFLLEATDVCRCQRLPSGQLHLRPVCDKSTSHVLKMVERSRKPRSGASCRAKFACQQRGHRVPWLPGIRLDEEQPVTEVAVATAPRCAGSVPVAVRDSILKLLASHPQGIHIDEFNQKHKLMFGHAITFIGFGFYSMKGMLESVPQLVRLKETPIGMKAFPLPALGSRRRPDENRPSHSRVPGELLPADAFLSYEDSVHEFNDRLLKVVSAQKTAVRVSDVLNLHLRQFGHTLDYQEYGFTSLLGALASLGPPFHLEKRADDWHVRVTRSGGGLPAAADCGDLPHPGTYHWTGVSSDGEDALPVGDSPSALPCLPDTGPARFAMQSLSWLENGRQVTTETGYPLLEVVITHVQSPGEFFFCLSGSACELPRLEAALAAVYGGAAGRRLPADHQLTIGRPLAAHTSAGWRRALLLGRVAEYVKVCLVDTGATLLLTLESVRILPNQYMELPVIAHQGTLARVEPLHGDSTWSRQSLRLFNDLVGGDIPLMATVLLQSQFVSSVLLCDTRGETDIHIGDHLVSAGQASVWQDDSPPIPLGTPHSRLLHDVYQLLDGQRRLRPDQPVKPDCNMPVGQTVTQQGRVPPEGAEPLSPTSRPQPGTSQMETRHEGDQVTSLKVQCYDTQKQIRAAPVGLRRAALHARLRRLETQLERLFVGQSTPPAGL